MTDKQIIIYKKECYNEPHCSLNQVLEQLEAYKMEAEEGKEINAELKAENKTQKETIDGFLTILDKLGKSNIKLRETLTEIKELLLKTPIDSQMHCVNAKSVILQKISECEVE